MSHVHGLEDNTVSMPTLQDFFFGKHKNLHSKIQMESHRIPNSQGDLEKEEQNWSPTKLDSHFLISEITMKL